MKAIDILPDILMSEHQINERTKRAGCPGMFQTWLMNGDLEEYSKDGISEEEGGSGVVQFYRLVTPHYLKQKKLIESYGKKRS